MVADPKLLKAARVLLGWSQEDLALRAGVGRTTLSKMEAGRTAVRLGTILALQKALEDGGIKFLGETEADGTGIRLRRQ